MVTKFRLQLFADNGRQSTAPFFTADVRPDTVGHVIALFTENRGENRAGASEGISLSKTTGAIPVSKQRKTKVGKVVRGITRDLTAFLADHKGQMVTVDLCSRGLRHYTRRQVANCLYMISRRGEAQNVGRGQYQVPK